MMCILVRVFVHCRDKCFRGRASLTQVERTKKVVFSSMAEQFEALSKGLIPAVELRLSWVRVHSQMALSTAACTHYQTMDILSLGGLTEK